MRILQVIASLAPRYGGPSVACPALCRELARRGHEVSVYSTDVDGDQRLDVPLDLPVQQHGVEFRYFRGWTRPGEYKFSPALWRALRERVQRFDVAHIYSVYGFTTLAAIHTCRKSGVPYLLHPHGSLDPYLRRRHRWRKWLYTTLFVNRGFRRAEAVLFNSAEEMRLAAGWSGLNCPSDNGRQTPKEVVVYVGVEDEWFQEPSQAALRSFAKKFPHLAKHRLVVFFGRLNFKKGLDILVQAFARVGGQRGDVHLVLAGPDNEGYGRKVREWLKEGGVLEKATFTGPLLGEERFAVLYQANVFVLPSYTENFGAAAAEAMACGVPVVISDRVNIHPEVREAGAGLVVRCDPRETAQALLTLLDNPALSKEMGRRGRQLVEQKMTWKVIGDQMIRVYGELVERSATREEIRARAPRAQDSDPQTGRCLAEREKQVRYYAESVDAEEEITRPRCYPRPVQYLLDFKIRTAWQLLDGKGPTAGKGPEKTLVVCCGSGMEAEMVARAGRRVIALDLSFEAVCRARQRARRYGLEFDLVVGDAEHLPFRAAAVDFVFVHDGLHHLPDAYRGVREMLRVARRAVVIAEPADAALTRLAVKLGISGEYEEAGNYVHRLRPEELAEVFRESGLADWRFRRNLVYYQPWTYRFYIWFERRPFFWLFLAGFHLGNLLLGRWGNSLRAVAWKPESAGEGEIR